MPDVKDAIKDLKFCYNWQTTQTEIRVFVLVDKNKRGLVLDVPLRRRTIFIKRAYAYRKFGVAL
jgi:hypothetical protein